MHRRKLQWTGDWRTIDWRLSVAIIAVLRGVGSKLKATITALEQIAALSSAVYCSSRAGYPSLLPYFMARNRAKWRQMLATNTIDVSHGDWQEDLIFWFI
jgi:hypothetical protein